MRARRCRFSISTQYGIKFLVDCLSKGTPGQTNPWHALALLAGFIAADNLLWRVAGWIAASTFVRVTGDLRRELFEHLMGHSPSYFSKRLPGVLTSRITATSNASFTIENMFIWNVLPPCVATLAAIGFIATVSLKMAGVPCCHRRGRRHCHLQDRRKGQVGSPRFR